MKRRTFLGIGLGALGLPILSKAGGRLYAVPGSVTGGDSGNDLMRLSLARAGVPTDAWKSITAFETTWRHILDVPEERRRFQANPEQYFLEKGISPEVLAADDMDVDLLKLLANDSFLESARQGDFTTVLSRMQQAGLIGASDNSSLRSRLLEVMKHDADGLRNELVNLNQSLSQAEVDDALRDNEELLYIYNEVTRTAETVAPMVVAAAAVVVVIAAAVVVYVSVGAIVTVGVTAGFSVTVAVTVGVAAHTKLLSTSPVGTAGKLAALDPETARRYDTMVRAARISGQKPLEVAALKDLISSEIDAFVNAAQDLGILEYRLGDNPKMMQAIKRLAYRSYGLAD